MRCKHCGSEEDLIIRKSGNRGGVCRGCRRLQINRCRSQKRGSAAPDYVRRLQAPKTETAASGRSEAIQRALALTKTSGVGLVEALRMEGVI